MRALLDTHAFLWWLADSGRLSDAAHRVIADEANDILVSATSAWEIAANFRLGSLPSGEAAAFDLAGAIADPGKGSRRRDASGRERRVPGLRRPPYDAR